MTQELHDAENGPEWLDTYIFCWSRFICREGENRFETFDFESLRWMQLHIRNASRPVVVSHVGARRRVFPWPQRAQILCDEPDLQRLFEASLNTLHNSCQETCVDGMGRERQQYSGDGGHQLQAVRYAFGETRLPARFLATFSQGMTLDGYFLDCWPGFDRLARLMQRQIGATQWGPLLDHGVGFNFDCWQHYWESGDVEALREPYPRLLRFARYLRELRRDDGLLPVENIGVPAVWIDHHAYRQQRHKQCAFNLYAAAMLGHALAPICRALGEEEEAQCWEALGAELLAATQEHFWDEEQQLFVANRRWRDQESETRLCDCSLATSLLFDQCPRGATQAAASVLAEAPPQMGLSYPANAGWRYRALARAGRADVVVKDLREIWAKMASVRHNNTLQETWRARPDSHDQWSHCPVAPLFVLFTDLLGVRPLAPGFARYEVQPQLADLGALDVTVHTPQGALRFQSQPEADGHRLRLTAPERGDGTLFLPGETAPERHALRAGEENSFLLKGKA